jgi:hypothetical protein
VLPAKHIMPKMIEVYSCGFLAAAAGGWAWPQLKNNNCYLSDQQKVWARVIVVAHCRRSRQTPSAIHMLSRTHPFHGAAHPHPPLAHRWAGWTGAWSTLKGSNKHCCSCRILLLQVCSSPTIFFSTIFCTILTVSQPPGLLQITANIFLFSSVSTQECWG